jgi:hypothetical protein
MRDDLGILLRNGGLEHVRNLLKEWKEPSNAIKSAPQTKARRVSVASFTAPAQDRDDKALARYRYHAARIEAIVADSLDYQLHDALSDAAFETKGELNKRDRVLSLWLENRNDFEELERQTIFNKLYAQRKKTTHYTVTMPTPANLAPGVIEAMEGKIREAFSKHDGSGRFVTSYPEQTEDGGANYAFSLSQVPQSREQYEDNGQTTEAVFRGLIWGHFRYDKAKRAFSLSISQGGQSVRDELAHAFVQTCLGVDETPAVVKSERVELRNLLSSKELPALQGHAEAEAKVTEVRLIHPSLYGGTVFTLRAKAGLAPGILKRLFGDNASDTQILSVTTKISDLHISDTGKPVTVSVILHADGGLSFGGVPIDREALGEAVRASWLNLFPVSDPETDRLNC